MPNFAYFIFWFTSVLFTIFYGLLLAGVWYFTDSITVEMRRVSQWKFFLIGLLSMLNGLFMLFSNSHVPGLMQALLGPNIVTIPMSMLFSFLILRVRVTCKQMIGLGVILVGLAVAIYPSVFDSGSNEKSTGNIWWNMIFFLGSVPIALASVFQEKYFNETPIHLAYMLGWVTLWQLGTVLISFPVDAIPKFGTLNNFSDLLSHQWYGLRCLVGYDVPKDVCYGCDCSSAWLPLTLFTFSYILSNFTLLGVVKYGSATFSYIVSTLVTPLSTFCFALRFIMGDGVEVLTAYNYSSLIVLLIGVILYRYFDQQANTLDTASATFDALEPQTINANDKLQLLFVSITPTYSSMQPNVFAKTVTFQEAEKDKSHWTFP